MKITEILSGPEKWCKKAFEVDAQDGHLRVCLWTAAVWTTVPEVTEVHKVGVAAKFDQCTPIIVIIEDVLREWYAERGQDKRFAPIGPWNDAPERTFDEVHAVAAEADRRIALR